MKLCIAAWQWGSHRAIQKGPHGTARSQSPTVRLHRGSCHSFTWDPRYYETTGKLLFVQAPIQDKHQGNGPLDSVHLHNADKWQEMGVTVIMVYCGKSGGKLRSFASWHNGQLWLLQNGVYHVSAAAVPAHQYFLQNVLKLLMSNFYACSTYTNQIILKTSQLIALKVFTKNPTC